MNPSILDQSLSGIPGGPLPKSSYAKKDSRRKPVAAVIRPVPRQLGKQGSLRIDPADSSPRHSHARGYSLTEYVTWLRKKIEAEGANGLKRSGDVNSSVATQSPVARASSRAASGTFSSMTDTDQVQVAEGRVSSGAPKGVRFEELSGVVYTPAAPAPNKSPVHRIDEAHPMEAPSEQAQETMFPYSKMFDLSKAQEETGPVEAGDTQSFIAAVSKAIAAVITEMPEPVFEQRVREHFKSDTHLEAAQSLVQAKELDEAKLRQFDSVEDDAQVAEGSNHYFGIDAETTHETGFASLQETFEVPDSVEPAMAELAESEAIESESDEPSIATPLVSLPTEAEAVASEILSHSSKEIPTGIAAWDVEDFRWPVVTNQMIVSGAQAIDHLTESVFDMLSPSCQRLAITGLTRGDGTSSIAISLARWVAAFGKNVLLVDADVTSTNNLSTQIGLAPNLSWVNAVNQNLPAAEVIIRSQKMNLCVMPLAPTVTRSSWPRFIYDNLGELIDQVRGYFDLVIVDAGPSQQLMAELSRPRHMVDATLMVHDGEDSPEFKQAKNMLEGFGLNRFIVAKNRVHQKTVDAA